jgi:hypothetical protein
VKKVTFIELKQREAIKRRIDSFGRKKFCEKFGYCYGTINNKLNGFLRITDEEYATLVNKISKCEAKK